MQKEHKKEGHQKINEIYTKSLLKFKLNKKNYLV